MKYFRVATNNTPEVTCDLSHGFISISGRSTTMNSVEFYHNFMIELDSSDNEEKDVHLDMNMQYFNTSSAKSIYDLLRKLKARQFRGNKVTINWFYNHFDTDMCKMGKDFSELVEIDFRYLPIGA